MLLCRTTMQKKKKKQTFKLKLNSLVSPRSVQNICQRPKFKEGETNLICTHTLKNSETSFTATILGAKHLLSRTHTSCSLGRFSKLNFSL